MLGNNKVITPIAVHDLENAVAFYCEILGLKIALKNSEGVVLESDGGFIAIHESATAGASQATCAWWTVDDVDAVVKYLKAHGVTFEKNYDLPHAARKNDIYHMGDINRAAWFKDPDGNILGFGNF
ncbi:MAG: Glyoxalase-like domain protein [Candidatus Saccharibacteria bacterium]|nr:Glyoxalase-like domain protein [Candidatus Saccharibacteria bacterium]